MIKTKTKKKLKHLHHTVTRRKLLKKRAAHKLSQAFFAIVATVSMGTLAFATIATKPTINLNLNINQKPRSLASEPAPTGADQTGIASWYALGLPNPEAHTCASTKFPRGTYLKVKNLRNGKEVVCLVNDYGPEAWTKRVIDMSLGAARVLDMVFSGTAPVEVRVVPPPTGHNLKFPSSFSGFLGYKLCTSKFTAAYCEKNRQQKQTLE